ncbi:ABC transporter permease [Sinosporangium siamense]|uniref:Sulfonate ABC transporter n=1 Tax=Sinosporangium siamense TaxID=1367973 RepID=A0A919RNI1_9ACTN|nr:ABC transporter permease [Sinosporangium siamense]GII97027.1 sulfonate ABC transporter [Sinosporangium siamense]
MTTTDGPKSSAREDLERRLRGRRPGSALKFIGPFSPLLLLVVWEAASRGGLLDARFFPPPTSIAGTFWELLTTGTLLEHSLITLTRVGIGIVLGGVPGLVLGIAFGAVQWLRVLAGPIFASLLPIPKIAILPLLLLIFGVEETSKYVIVAIGVFFYIFYNTMGGVLQTPPIYFDVARTSGASRWRTWSTVALPAALPSIFTGLKLAVGGAFVVIAASEFLGSRTGVGYMIWSAWQTLAVSKMFVGIVTISLLGYLAGLLVALVERRLVPWSRQ